MRVNFPRLQSNIEAVGTIGRRKGAGVYRMAFSDGDMEARQWLKNAAELAGLAWEEDGAANIWIRTTLDRPKSGLPRVLTGSHMDSVPNGGNLDGALGVLAGLECLTRIQEEGIKTEHPVELVAFTDEEGRFGGMLGSQAIAGILTPDVIEKAKDLAGNSLVEVMQQRGFDARASLRARVPREQIKAFVELHIEQGPILDRARVPIGVVEGIVGLFKWAVTFSGTANHAGTTPMDMRSDAFQGVAEFARELQRILDENGSPHSVCNIGRIEIKPGVSNVVPGRVDFSLEARDLDAQILGDLAYAFRRAMSAIARRRNLMFEFEVMSEINPTKCDRGIVETINKVCADLNIESMRIASGAAHDAQTMAGMTRSSMVFVPSIDGRSHHPAEWTAWEDIECGANVLLNTLLRLAN